MSRIERYINETELRKALQILKPDNQLFEIRILTTDKKKSFSGYFRDADTLLRALETIDLSAANIYITLNRLSDDCYFRLQRDRFLRTSDATSDGDVIRREWFFVDIDPIRAASISSTDAELTAAKETARKVYAYLHDLGFSEPLKALSGNGCHLLYRIDLPNDAESKHLVEKGLKVLAELFNDDKAKIDVVNGNASRICKLYGTLSQKGSNATERPHRMSRMFKGPEGVTSAAYLRKLAEELPEPTPTPQTVEQFDLLTWMSKYGLTVFRESDGDDCKIYALDECPFDHSHRHGDSKIFHYRNGAIAFKCHHNSCRGYHWQDVRKLFEPDAYDKPADDGHIDDGYQQYKTNREKRIEADYEELTGEEELNDEPMFYTANMVLQMPDEKEEFILSGCTQIDRKLRGLKKGSLTVLSGNRSSAKSTWLNQVVLNAIEHKNTVVMYSGELSQRTVFKWFFLQAAGNDNIESPQSPGFYYTPKKTKAQIAVWMDPYLHLYNNRYGNNFTAMQSILLRRIRETKADLVILDNLMTLDIRELNQFDKYAAQSAFVLALKRIAMQTNTHIIFVAHPRKTTGFLRLEDVAGSSDIVNAVDNAFIIHRRNKDFEDRYKEFSKHTIEDCDNVIEICKDRENGTQDEFIPLWFDAKSKRLKNEPDEYVVYGWKDTYGFAPATEEEQAMFEESIWTSTTP